MKVFYRPEQSVQTENKVGLSSLSLGKPRRVVEDWLQQGLIDKQDIMSFEPLTMYDMMLAHDPEYVRGVMTGEVENGFGTFDRDIAKSLLYTTGSFYAASKYAVEQRETVCSPTSGFHHAHIDHAAGYCTFNGLIIAALKLMRQKLVRSVLIIDGDAHYGDGTDDIIERKGLRHTIVNYTAKTWWVDPKQFVEGLHLSYWHRLYNKGESKMWTPDLVMYQAGADSWKEDPYGAGKFTEKQMKARDDKLFRWVALQGIPCVWNLAGGYSEDDVVTKLHRSTMETALRY